LYFENFFFKFLDKNTKKAIDLEEHFKNNIENLNEKDEVLQKYLIEPNFPLQKRISSLDIQRFQENQSKKEFYNSHLIGDTIGHFTECNKEYSSDDSRVQNSIPESSDYQYFEYLNLDNNSINFKKEQKFLDDSALLKNKKFSILEEKENKQEIIKTHNNFNKIRINNEYKKQKFEETEINNIHLNEVDVKINLNNKIYSSKENANRVNNKKNDDNVKVNRCEKNEIEDYEQEEEYEEDENDIYNNINNNLFKGKINPDGNIKIVHNN